MEPHVLLAMTYLNRPHPRTCENYPSFRFRASAICAIADLYFAGHVIIDVPRKRLHLTSTTDTGHELFNFITRCLHGADGNKLRKVIEQQCLVIDGLCQRYFEKLGLMKTTEEYLTRDWPTPYMVDAATRYDIQQDLIRVIRGGEFTDYHVALLGTIAALDMYDVAFSTSGITEEYAQEQTDKFLRERAGDAYTLHALCAAGAKAEEPLLRPIVMDSPDGFWGQLFADLGGGDGGGGGGGGD